MNHDSSRLEWDGKTLSVTVPKQLIAFSGNEDLPIECEPDLLYVWRIKESGTKKWSFGVETPLNSVRFTDLKSDTEYDISVSHKNEFGEGPPAYSTERTGSKGEISSSKNVSDSGVQ